MSEEINNQFDREPHKFGVPEGYFSSSAKVLLEKLNWQEEHRPYTKLSSLDKTQVFSLPDGYFQSSAAELEILEFPLLCALKGENHFTVPEGYFEENAPSSFGLGENGDGSSFLKHLPKENLFKVDDNYFLKNKSALEKKLKKEEARIIQIFNRRTAYAAAAFLLVALSIWSYSLYFSPATEADCGTIACVDKSELIKNNNLDNLEEDELYELVNTSELKNKLENTNGTDKNNKPDTSLDDISVDELMEDI